MLVSSDGGDEVIDRLSVGPGLCRIGSLQLSSTVKKKKTKTDRRDRIERLFVCFLVDYRVKGRKLTSFFFFIFYIAKLLIRPHY